MTDNVQDKITVSILRSGDRVELLSCAVPGVGVISSQGELDDAIRQICEKLALEIVDAHGQALDAMQRLKTEVKAANEASVIDRTTVAAVETLHAQLDRMGAPRAVSEHDHPLSVLGRLQMLDRDDQDNLIDDVEVAKLLGVKHLTVVGWRKHGKGPAYHSFSSKCVRYKRPDVEHFVAKHRRSTEDS